MAPYAVVLTPGGSPGAGRGVVARAESDAGAAGAPAAARAAPPPEAGTATAMIATSGTADLTSHPDMSFTNPFLEVNPHRLVTVGPRPSAALQTVSVLRTRHLPPTLTRLRWPWIDRA